MPGWRSLVFESREDENLRPPPGQGEGIPVVVGQPITVCRKTVRASPSDVGVTAQQCL